MLTNCAVAITTITMTSYDDGMYQAQCPSLLSPDQPAFAISARLAPSAKLTVRVFRINPTGISSSPPSRIAFSLVLSLVLSLVVAM